MFTRCVSVVVLAVFFSGSASAQAAGGATVGTSVTNGEDAPPSEADAPNDAPRPATDAAPVEGEPAENSDVNGASAEAAPPPQSVPAGSSPAGPAGGPSADAAASPLPAKSSTETTQNDVDAQAAADAKATLPPKDERVVHSRPGAVPPSLNGVDSVQIDREQADPGLSLSDVSAIYAGSVAMTTIGYILGVALLVGLPFFAFMVGAATGNYGAATLSPLIGCAGAGVASACMPLAQGVVTTALTNALADDDDGGSYAASIAVSYVSCYPITAAGMGAFFFAFIGVSVALTPFMFTGTGPPTPPLVDGEVWSLMFQNPTLVLASVSMMLGVFIASAIGVVQALAPMVVNVLYPTLSEAVSGSTVRQARASQPVGRAPEVRFASSHRSMRYAP